MDKAKGDRIEGGKWRMGENGDNCTYNTIKKINTIQIIKNNYVYSL